MTVAGPLSPFDWVRVTVMPAGSHDRDMADTVREYTVICAMFIPLTAWNHRHGPVGKSMELPQYTHHACTVRTPHTGPPQAVFRPWWQAGNDQHMTQRRSAMAHQTIPPPPPPRMRNSHPHPPTP